MCLSLSLNRCKQNFKEKCMFLVNKNDFYGCFGVKDSFVSLFYCIEMCQCFRGQACLFRRSHNSCSLPQWSCGTLAVSKCRGLPSMCFVMFQLILLLSIFVGGIWITKYLGFRQVSFSSFLNYHSNSSVEFVKSLFRISDCILRKHIKPYI